MGIGTRVVVSGSVVDGGVEEVLAGYRGYLVGEPGGVAGDGCCL
jgi:hypothetical protein